MTMSVNRREFVGLTTMAVVERSAAVADEPQGRLTSSIERRDPATTHDAGLFLFVDDDEIQQVTNLHRERGVIKPLDQPVVFPENPNYESHAAWGNVIRDEDGVFRMWYCALMLGDRGNGHHEMARAGVWGRGNDYGFHPRSAYDVREINASLIKYAESKDGIHWHKPELGLVSFRGSKQNNIVMNGQRIAQQTGGAVTNTDGCTVVRDNQETNPRRRYKMISHWESIHCHDNKSVSGSLKRSQEKIKWFHAARGKYITFSADGIHWDQPFQKIRFPDGGGDRFLVVPDHRHRRWCGYSRVAEHSAAAFSYSTNLTDWSPPVRERLMTTQALKMPKVECLVPFNYGNQDLGVPVGMDKPSGSIGGARAMVPFLASHRDGKPWQFVGDATPLLPMGPPSSYYASGVVPLHNEPFIVGDQLLIYFNAFSRYQNPPCPFGTRTIGVATLRRDGFAGMRHLKASPTGTLITKPFRLTSKRVDVNVQIPSSGGQLTAALLDESETIIPGCDFDQCTPITQDAVRASLNWNQDAMIEKFVGQKVRIAFRLDGDITLYAFAITT